MKQSRALITICVLSAACAGEEGGTGGVGVRGSAIAILDYIAVAPPDWQVIQPGSEFRLAEFTTPAVGDAGGGSVVVFYFGPGQGGSLEANAARWQAQFTDEAGQNPEPEISPVDGAAFPTSVVTLRGRYARGVGMGGTDEEALPDQVLFAAVVETPQGNIFVQLHGPAASVLGQREAFFAFVGGIRAHPEG